jgi:hypothetical protein
MMSNAEGRTGIAIELGAVVTRRATLGTRVSIHYDKGLEFPKAESMIRSNHLKAEAVFIPKSADNSRFSPVLARDC